MWKNTIKPNRVASNSRVKISRKCRYSRGQCEKCGGFSVSSSERFAQLAITSPQVQFKARLRMTFLKASMWLSAAQPLINSWNGAHLLLSHLFPWEKTRPSLFSFQKAKYSLLTTLGDTRHFSPGQKTSQTNHKQNKSEVLSWDL